jgi:serine/threonine protein kinase
LLDWNKSWLTNSLEPIKPPTANRKGNRQFQLGPQCLNFILEEAGQPLSDFQAHISFSLFRAILFQVLYALQEAQRACEFVHNDLHAKNILVTLTPCHSSKTTYREYTDPMGNASWFVDQSVHVKIIDFGLSRIKLSDGTIISNPHVRIGLVFMIL